MTRRLLQTAFLIFALCGCPQKKSTEPPAETEASEGVVLERATYDELKGFQADGMEDAYPAFKRNCEALQKKRGRLTKSAEIKISAQDLLQICVDFTNIRPEEFKQFIKDNFTPFLVTYSGSSEGKFTAYYEAALKASYTPSERYKFPVYGKPDDLIEFNPHDFDPSLPQVRLVGRVEGQRLVPYFTRREIAEQAFKAPVILWADSYIDIYLMQIQGSAVAELDDGTHIRIAYADNNGHAFRGIGSILLAKGLLKPGEGSMGDIKRWLKKNPLTALEHMNDNHRYIFHRLSRAEGPTGAMGAALTAGRSLAVDTAFIPLGAVLWLETEGPHGEEINKLVLAQDVGGAIKGAVRGDYFWGSGSDDVLEAAGKMNSRGRYFILLPKEGKKGA